jgi:hypothetical protein
MSSVNSSTIVNMVPIENSLAKKQYIANIIKTVVSKVNELENVPSLKNDLELLKYIVSLVLVQVKPKYKLSEDDIESIILTILIQIFNLNPNEVDKVKEDIKFLQDNNLIKTFSSFQKGINSTIEYLKKKLA